MKNSNRLYLFCAYLVLPIIPLFMGLVISSAMIQNFFPVVPPHIGTQALKLSQQLYMQTYDVVMLTAFQMAFILSIAGLVPYYFADRALKKLNSLISAAS